MSSGWYVLRYKNGVSVSTNSDAPWYDYGRRKFGVFGCTRKQALEEAIKWVNSEYGQREFVRNKIGDYVEKEVNKKFPIRRD